MSRYHFFLVEKQSSLLCCQSLLKKQTVVPACLTAKLATVSGSEKLFEQQLLFFVLWG